MKKILVILFCFLSIFARCQNNTSWFNSYPGDVPRVQTNSASSNIASDGLAVASVNSKFLSDSGSPLLEKGALVAGNIENLTIDNYFASKSIGGDFDSELNYASVIFNLPTQTIYYARAYAINSYGVGYGEILTFTTATPGGGSLNAPTITTVTASSITSNSAISGGVSIIENGSAISSKGVRYGTDQTLELFTSTSDGSGTNNFTSILSGLSSGTTYYYKAWAVNANGFGFGNTLSFATLSSSGLITATATTSFASETTTTYSVYWGISLSSPATSPVSFTLNVTNQTNTGTIPITISFKIGQTDSWSNIVDYNKASSSYTAYCNFGTMPTGYTGTNSASYVIPALGVVCSVPTVTTGAISSITQTTASGGGNVTSDGGCAITSRGLCWSTSPNPTTANFWIVAGSGIGAFPANIINLIPNNTYYVRAFSVNSSGTAYGNEVSFTTLSPTCTLPTFISAAYGNATTSSIEINANINSDGGCPVTSRGFQYSTDNTFTSILGTITIGSGIGSYGTTVTGLNCGTHYYFRPWATNSTGTNYANALIGSGAFTSDCVSAVVRINSSNSVNTDKFIFYCEVVSSGTFSITERGLCYSESILPTISDTKIISGSGTGLYSCTTNSLINHAQYYARPYTINSVGEVTYGTVDHYGFYVDF